MSTATETTTQLVCDTCDDPIAEPACTDQSAPLCTECALDQCGDCYLAHREHATARIVLPTRRWAA